MNPDTSPEAALENKQWMLDEFWDRFTKVLAADRGLSEDQIIAIMEHALFSAEEALEAGLIDGVKYWDEVEAMLKGDDDDELRTVSQSSYAEIEPGKLGLEGDKTIAVIHAQGMIAGRTSGVNPLLGVTMGHETVIAEFDRARKDEDVAAIVFRVDSGGGDALGSDLMGHAVEITTQVKPVVVSMVNVAASGGYHIAYRGSKIIAATEILRAPLDRSLELLRLYQFGTGRSLARRIASTEHEYGEYQTRNGPSRNTHRTPSCHPERRRTRRPATASGALLTAPQHRGA